MEVVKSRPGNSIASRVAAYRRCGSCLVILLIILVVIGYTSFNKSKENISYVKQTIRDTSSSSSTKTVVPVPVYPSLRSSTPSASRSNITSNKESTSVKLSPKPISSKNISSSNISSSVLPKRMRLLDYATGKYILGIGDSLTYGVTLKNVILSKHSYIERLSNMLGPKIQARAFGYPELKTLDLIEEIDGIMSDSKFRKNITIVAILSGTNDLLQGDLSYQTILENLVEMHKKIHESEESKSRSVYTIAISIPYVNRPRVNDRIRHRVNQGLKEYVEACSFRVFYCDLSIFDPPPKNDTSIVISRRLDDSVTTYLAEDGIHLTTAGYDLMAEVLYDTISKAEIQPALYNNKTC